MYENVEKSSPVSLNINDKLIIAISLGVGLVFSILSYQFSLLIIIALILGVVGAVAIFRYPEVSIVLAFSSGIFKEWLAENVAIFASFDFTIAIFGLSFMIIFYNLLLQGDFGSIRFDKSFLPLLLFTVFMLISTLYTPSPRYGSFKTFSFLVFNWGVFLMPFLVLRKESQIRRMTMTLVLLATTVSVFTISTLLKGVMSGDIIYSYRASFLGVNPISFANWVGVIDVLLIAHYPILKRKSIKAAAIVSIIIMTVSLFVANSRGPMLSFVMTSGVFLLSRLRTMKATRVVLIGVFGVLLITTIFSVLPEQVTSRYVDLFGGGSDVVSRTASKYTINTRLFAWETTIVTAFSSVKNLFFGIGIGGFSNIFYGLDVRLYPHNMIFETLCELGLVGVVLLLWHFKMIFFKAFSTLKRLALPQRQILFAYLLGALFLFFSAQFSGDLNDNRRIWFFLGACIAIMALFNSREKQDIDD